QGLPEGQILYRYSLETGNLERVDAPGGALIYTYDGNLPTSEGWTGAVVGNVSRTYDQNLRVTSQSVNGGSTVNLSYDADDLLTGAGTLTLNRSPQTGLLDGTTLGTVSDTFGYNAMGELTSYQVTVGSTPIFSELYTRGSSEVCAGVTNVCIETSVISPPPAP